MMEASLIAPCGMNCKVCVMHMRKNNKCPGCNGNEMEQPRHCLRCCIKQCDLLQQLETKLCSGCVAFPCTRLRRLERRYTAEFKVSMIENLHTIQRDGMEAFLKQEEVRWKCPVCGGVICLHKGGCLRCNTGKAAVE